MFKKIANEVDRCCKNCPGPCTKVNCLAYRIDQIITDHNAEIAKINIDDFFVQENGYQLDMFTRKEE